MKATLRKNGQMMAAIRVETIIGLEHLAVAVHDIDQLNATISGNPNLVSYRRDMDRRTVLEEIKHQLSERGTTHFSYHSDNCSDTYEKDMARAMAKALQLFPEFAVEDHK